MCIRSWTQGNTSEPPQSQVLKSLKLTLTSNSNIYFEVDDNNTTAQCVRKERTHFSYLSSLVILEAKAIGNHPLIFHFDRNSV